MIRRFKHNTQSNSKDWWDRADIVAKFMSSIVIAGVGLYLTTTIQKSQIDFSKAVSDNDTKLKQATLTTQLIQHLTSADTNQREIAVIALRGNLPNDAYHDILKVVALRDDNSAVRIAAIEQLANSKDEGSISVLTSIAQTDELPKKERKAAYSSTVKSTFGNSNAYDWCFIGAGEFAYEGLKYSGGFFTYNILNFFQKEKANRSVKNLFSFLQSAEKSYLNEPVPPDPQSTQNPVLIASEGYNLSASIMPDASTKMFIVGIDYETYGLKYSVSDAKKFRGLLIKDLGVEEKNITFLANPTKQQFLTALSSFSRGLVSNAKVLFYFSGMSYLTKSSGLALLTKDIIENPTGILLSDINNYFKTCGNLTTIWDSSTGNLK